MYLLNQTHFYINDSRYQFELRKLEIDESREILNEYVMQYSYPIKKASI